MFSNSLQKTINLASNKAKEKQQETMTVEHLLLALLADSEVGELMSLCGANIQILRSNLEIFLDELLPFAPLGKDFTVHPSPECQKVLQRSAYQAQSIGKEVTNISLLAAILGETSSQAVHFLNKEKIYRTDVIGYLSGTFPFNKMEEERKDHDDIMPSDIEPDSDGMLASLGENALERYAINLNEQAKLGKIDPLIGRKEEVERTIQVLCRRRKNNPLLIGESGVGKTAIAEGLARLIVEDSVPAPLATSVIYNLDMGYLLAGTKYRGDFEKRFKGVLKSLKQIPNAIIFIDEIHTLIGAGAASGGAMDASNLIKPMLVNGDMRCIGSTTYQEYRNIFEKDHALARRFQKIDVPEPSVEETYEILKGLKDKFESYHDVVYTLRALKAAAALADQYINDRHLPDKAIDIVDEAGAYQRLQPANKRKRVIGAKEIEAIVTRIARVPPGTVSLSDKVILKNLDRNLKMLVYGQDQAIDSLATAIKLSRSGLREPQKPVGCFLLSGPTGVGKTEVTIQLAKLLGIELIRFDMSEYMERHTVSRLIGAPPGYVGYEQAGLLTEGVMKHPYAVILLDEIEKAHSDVFNLLLQVMDYGKLTDNNGRVADFHNIILIMTTNAGAEEIEHMKMGFVEEAPGNRKDDLEAIKRTFSPEFRNRLDAIVSFKPLQQDTLKHIVDKFILQLEAQLEHKHVHLRIDEASRLFLAQHGYDPKMGARPMARLIQESIKKPLAEELLFGKLMTGGSVAIEVKNGSLALNIKGLHGAHIRTIA